MLLICKLSHLFCSLYFVYFIKPYLICCNSRVGVSRRRTCGKKNRNEKHVIKSMKIKQTLNIKQQVDYRMG